MKNGMLLPIRRSAGLKDKFYYNNAQESSHATLKGKIKAKKILEATGYRPGLKCTWPEAISVYREFVLQARRNSRAVIGKGPYSPNAQYKNLTVTDAKWSSTSRKEREKHLQALGTAVQEELGDDLTSASEKQDQPEVMGRFESSGLPEFFKRFLV